MKNIVWFLKKIEGAVYPSHMQYMQDLETISDLADYCECRARQLIIETGPNWYFLAAQKKRSVEIVDICADGAFPVREMLSLVRKYLNKWRGKRITLDARHTTSWKLVAFLEKSGKVKITHHEEWWWGNELMHEVGMEVLAVSES